MKIVKKLQGRVIKLSNLNTASVEVSRKVAHPKYNKLYTVSKKFLVDYSGDLSVGDVVEIESVKPISKFKSFKVGKILESVKQISEAQEEAI